MLALLLLGACRQEDHPGEPGPRREGTPVASSAYAPEPGQPVPPAPPLREDFEGQPRLSLFPRIGDYRPENEDEVGLPFWNSYIEHVVRTSGVVEVPIPLGQGGRAFSFRSVAGLDSLGFFSPLAVEPETAYRVSARFKTALPEGGETGIGILEFDEFLWIGEQYPRSLAEQRQTGVQEGLKLRGDNNWEPQSFTFVTGEKTRMVHLIFYREGSEDRAPVLVDEISIEKITP
ncbi:hypothetical protein DESUT3_26430 [Desulfuromonas versatilis]|uniref:Uncharacterized protein n=1 Tax=Desulfuromonas versatilis TaxID=2802975 RepID=A0ABN6E180_9BACT|nr:hypothetical protein [Desulfuromonas versatilis]BCR05574.1 hypothetical protein DESUT3_26430 [Desulfuromonas versatilis]